MSWAEDMTDGTTRTDVLRASPPMFESRILDALSRVHPVVPIVIFLPAIAVLAARGLGAVSVGRERGPVLADYAVWRFFEYCPHRLVFPFEPQDGIGARFHWI